MKNLLFVLLISLSFTASAQMGIGVASPDASAQLEVASVSRGLLMPRMTLAQRNAIASPATSLMIYQTDQQAGYYYYTGAEWKRLGSGVNTIGDIKYSYQADNHNGWYRLVGTAVASLPAAAQASASLLGIVGALPDTRDKVIKHRASAGESIGSSSGSNTIALVQSNLPNITLTTSSAGAHTHNYSDAYWSSENAGNSGLLGSGANQDHDNARVYSTQTTSSAGAHTHTIPLNGGVAQTTIDNRQASFNLNAFIYLGN